MSTVQVIEKDGEFTAFDEETGTEVRGDTKSQALVALALELEKEVDEVSTAERYERLSTEVQRRAKRRDVSEDVVEDAIEWARQG